MTIVNCTPHAIVLNNGESFPVSGNVARVSSSFEATGNGFSRLPMGRLLASLKRKRTQCTLCPQWLPMQPVAGTLLSLLQGILNVSGTTRDRLYLFPASL